MANVLIIDDDKVQAGPPAEDPGKLLADLDRCCLDDGGTRPRKHDGSASRSEVVVLFGLGQFRAAVA